MRTQQNLLATFEFLFFAICFTFMILRGSNRIFTSAGIGGTKARGRLSRFGALSSLTSFKGVSPLSPTALQKSFRFVTASSILGLTSSSLFSSFSSGTSIVSAAAPVEHFRSDYTRSPYIIPNVSLFFKLSASDSTVITKSQIIRAQISTHSDLILDGEDVNLLNVRVNGVLLSEDLYEKTSTNLRIKYSTLSNLGDEFELETEVQIHPDKNLALSGLYKSGSSLLCTQCEAMGFRRITYHLDRPDILSKYIVRLEATKDDYPILLSNGNLIEEGELGDGKHFAVWEDPFPKPCYLFALVAGDLASISSEYTTTSGRVVKLGIYSDKENSHKLDHAMYSIKKSMQWDEDTFGLECDLDIYNIVATNDFNMGAMENKGLNIFNAAYVLADPKTATDDNYESILGVIAHEYFHNWSGNRVTVRDWFQLTLKEGLTVFRDQWFSSDVTSHAVKRIEDVRMLRSRQFAEDQGPMAHPIRPESYISMDNFYTATVYVKGAEVVRLYRTLLGCNDFKRGLEKYFYRYDGCAVTCDDFREAMSDANRDIDLSQLELWYSQAGTPIVDVTQSYDKEKAQFKLKFQQHTPSTPNQDEATKKPLLIPVIVGLLDKVTGREIAKSKLLKLTEREQEFVFDGIKDEPIASVLRDFSAPVKVNINHDDSDLALLMAYDTDPFNKWDAGNRLSSKLILDLAKLKHSEISAVKLPTHYVQAVKTTITTCIASKKSDFSLISYALQLPDEMTLSLEMSVIDPIALHTARLHVKKELANALKEEFEQLYALTNAKTVEYIFSPEEVGRRRLHNTCLDFLSHLEGQDSIDRAAAQFDASICMTDKIAALACLASKSCPERTKALSTFHSDANGDALVLNKWFSIQASADLPNLLETVKKLKTTHPDFILSNPNRFRSLIAVFGGNAAHFHAEDGMGYVFIADSIIEIDGLNPQVAARLASAFSQWKRFDSRRQELMKEQLQRIQSSVGLSKDTNEVVSRCLK